MGGHGNNYVYLLENRNDTGESPRNLPKGLLGEKMQPHDCNGGGNKNPKIGGRKMRIRKLTEGECMRLMGFEEKDTEACRNVGLSRANIYHQSGDSIITTVLVGIFGEALGIDYQKKIEDYSSKLHQETIAYMK